MLRTILVLFLTLFLAIPSWAQRRSAPRSFHSPPKDGGMHLTYDVGASTGSYAGQSYSEINLGLNWYLADWFNWRNALFSRFGSGESASGLDSSARFEYKMEGEDLGMKAFAGPGYRFSSKAMSAAFAEAGLIFRLGGLSLGAGAKYMQYTSPGTDSKNQELPKSDMSYFLILGGGGVL